MEANGGIKLKHKPTQVPGRPNYIFDFISQKEVKASPTSEEFLATQPFSFRLVNELGYPKMHIQTRPQFRVKESPGGRPRWPVDIAVFNNENHTYENVYIIIECKKRNIDDATGQLQRYLERCGAVFGVWFDGSNTIYIRKILSSDGTIKYVRVPGLPRYGDPPDHIIRRIRKELTASTNLTAIFKSLHNFLLAEAIGITRSEEIARQLIYMLFIKLYDEINTPLNDETSFQCSYESDPEIIANEIRALFDKVTSSYAEVFTEDDRLTLDSNSIKFIIGTLQDICIMESSLEALGEAFEAIVGDAVKGEEGQFFTPRNAIKFMVNFIKPEPNEIVLDPACGSGGFLIETLFHKWKKIDEKGKKLSHPEHIIISDKVHCATNTIHGIDKDDFLSKVAKAYMAFMGDGRSNVHCGNSLDVMNDLILLNPKIPKLNSIDIILTNPPFGKKCKVTGRNRLRQYELARKHKRKSNYYIPGELNASFPPQHLFIERCYQWLKPGGRMGIVMLESTFGMPKWAYIVDFIIKHFKILGIASMPEDLFQPYTHAKTCLVFLKKRKTKLNLFKEINQEEATLMATANWCGHDSMRLPTLREMADGSHVLLDDIPHIDAYFTRLENGEKIAYNSLGFKTKAKEIVFHSDAPAPVYIPRYYDPEVLNRIEKMKENYIFYSIDKMIKNKWIMVSTGCEPGKMAYGTGDISFVRTSDINNWELKLDPTKSVSNYFYEKYIRKNKIVKNGDIFIVRDGTYRVGTSGIVTQTDIINNKMLFAQGLLKIRVLSIAPFDSYYFIAALNHPVVESQMRCKQFTRDVIDTLGNRYKEILIPIPKIEEDVIDTDTVEKISNRISTVFNIRNEQKEFLTIVQSTGFKIIK